ncbi:hypothetical protein SAMN05421869_108355 [Nonomuraea jiangxiensis]|uniref:Uncharacterized protein n=2 Tax=Nonomuraea jiangxiensis TaxID=633440 RepID=A0A1G8QUG9_9ACTN|nr:hypothetical protein SAMN05421869_108355 [Nonomuraea jiangxiensis]
MAFVWEFAVVRRKRLGYRVQMDTQGWMEIVESDYLTHESDKTGIRVRFPNRRVVGMAVTEPEELSHFFVTDTGDGTKETEGYGMGEEKDAGVLKLPKVKLNPGAHYKVLAVLERKSGTPGKGFDEPVFRAEVTGRPARWLGWLARLKLARTESHTFASQPALVGMVLLVVAVLTQSGLTLFWREDPTR